jgi:hypothetical protein
MHECTIPIRMNSHGPTAHQRSEGEVGNRISPTAPPSTTVSALRPRPPPQLPAKRGTRRGSRHPIYQTPRRWRPGAGACAGPNAQTHASSPVMSATRHHTSVPPPPPGPGAIRTERIIMLTPQLTASRRAPPVRGAPTELGFRKASSRALGIGIPPAHVRLTRAPRRQRPGLQLIDDRSDPPLVYPRVPPVPRPQLLLDLVLAPTPVEIFWFSLHLAPTPPRPRVQKRRRRSSLSLSVLSSSSLDIGKAGGPTYCAAAAPVVDSSAGSRSPVVPGNSQLELAFASHHGSRWVLSCAAGLFQVNHWIPPSSVHASFCSSSCFLQIRRL